MRFRWSVAVIAAMVTGPGLAAIADDFVVDGGGWGHGVGMSQFGAYGMVLEDPSTTVDEIIGHFYSGAALTDGTGLASVPDWIFQPQALAVNVASRRTTLEFQVLSGSVDVCQRGDGSDSCATTDLTVAGGESVRVEHLGGNQCERARISGGSVDEATVVTGACSLDLTWDDSFGGSDPSTIIRIPDAGDSPDLEYARGPFHLRPSALEGFDVTARLGLEEYLYGIAEMPLSWPAETLKAQAVTARSYAVNAAVAWGGADGSGRRPDCGCHIRRTVADQNYDAWLVEGSDNGPKWREQAVDATQHRVVTHPQVNGGGSVVTTYYSSSSGGATENVEDVFGGPPQPHLKSVQDPWGGDPSVNPLANWQVTVPEEALRDRLCTIGHCWDRVSGARMLEGPPGARIRFVGLVGRDLRQADVSATWLYNLLNSRDERVSPYISDVLAPSPFVDIDTSVHHDDIVFIAELGVTKGCNPPANDRFCPGEAVTRQQMASFLVRALQLESSGEDSFTDDSGSVHEADINALAASGITRGCNPPDNTRFCPDSPVTRGQMAAFLVRAFEYDDPGEGDLFADDDGSEFQADIDRLATAGVTKGCNPPDNTRFCPNDPVTREQMASFLARALG